MADAKVTIDVEVNGADEAKTALDDVKKSQDASTESTKQNTDAVNENTAAKEKNAEATKSNESAQNKGTSAVKEAQGWLEKMSDKFLGQEIALRGAQHLNQAFALMMKGQFVGAIRMASAAVTEFTMAILANPIGALVTAVITVTAVVVGLANAWGDANDKLNEYINNHHKIEGFQRKAENVAAGGNRLESVSDEELEEMRADAKQRDDEARARVGYNLKQQKRWDESVQRHGTVANASWGGRRLVRAERWKERTESAMEIQEETGAALAEIEAEQARRRKPQEEAKKKASQQAARAAEEAAREEDRRRRERQKIEERSARLEDEKRYDGIESSDGKLAALQARKADLEEKLSDQLLGEIDPSGKLDIEEKLYSIEKQITAEKERQAEIEKERNDAQEDWLRNRKLAKSTEEERLKIINDEIAALRKLPRTAENEAKMRGLIDQRDAAQKDIDRKEEAKRKDAERAAAEQAENDKKLKDKTRDFLHRNDTDAQRMRDIRAQIGDAAASGDVGTMLDLMMQGESIADSHGKPKSKSQMRREARQAEKDEKEAQKEAVKMKAEISAIERGLRKGDASAVERVAKMNASAAGRASYEIKGGKLVKVEGTDQTNKLLEKVVEALS